MATGLPRRIMKETSRLVSEPIPGITALPDEHNVENKWSKRHKWSSALQIKTVLLSIQALLSAPNPDDPLTNNVAEKWKQNKEQAMETARTYTRLYTTKS